MKFVAEGPTLQIGKPFHSSAFFSLIMSSALRKHPVINFSPLSNLANRFTGRQLYMVFKIHVYF